jgi:uncharacterized protein with HEPN domain
MSRTYELYLRDILKAVERIAHYLEGMDEATFKQDDLRVDGILFNLMIIGEAVKGIPEDVRTQTPDVRWRDISRFRDRVVHHYFATDLGIVWEIVTIHLPVLQSQVEKLLQSIEDTADGEK